MRAIEVDGARFKQIRVALGVTQSELATVAGVAERTVRNAEAGRRVRGDFLAYLASALGVELSDLVAARAELQLARREQAKARHVLQAMEACVKERSLSEFRALALPRSQMTYELPDAPPLEGEDLAVDGMEAVVDVSDKLFAYTRAPEITEVRASGSFVIICGIDHLRVLATNKPFTASFQQIYEYDRGRIVRVDLVVDTHAWMTALT